MISRGNYENINKQVQADQDQNASSGKYGKVLWETVLFLISRLIIAVATVVISHYFDHGH